MVDALRLLRGCLFIGLIFAAKGLLAQPTSDKPRPPFFQNQTVEQQRDLAFGLIRKGVRALRQQGQGRTLRDVFQLQMAEGRYDDALETLDVIVAEENSEDDFFHATQAVYYATKKDHWKVYQALLGIVENPQLKISDVSRRRRADSLRSSMIHVLVQIPNLKAAESMADSMSMDPATLRLTAREFNPLGYHLLSGWRDIIERYLADKNDAQALRASKRFVDPHVRRRLLKPIQEKLERVESDVVREQLIRLCQKGVEDTSEGEQELAQAKIDEAIERKDFDRAEALLLSADPHQHYATIRSAVRLVEFYQREGLDDRADNLLEVICQTPQESFMDAAIAKALRTAGRLDLAKRYLGPARYQKQPFYRRHPLAELASAYVETDLSTAMELVEAIEPVMWQAQAYEMLFQKAKPVGDVKTRIEMKKAWLEKAVTLAAQIEDVPKRESVLIHILHARSDWGSVSRERWLTLLQNDSRKADLLSSWLVRWIHAGENQDQWLRSIDRIAAWDQDELQSILSAMAETGNIEGTVGVLKKYRHATQYSDEPFRAVFRTIGDSLSPQGVMDLCRDQPQETRARIVCWAFKEQSEERQAEMEPMILSVIEGATVDLQLTNRLLQRYAERYDTRSIVSVLNLELPDEQYLFEESCSNRWTAIAEKLGKRIGGWSLIELAGKVECHRGKTNTFCVGVRQLFDDVENRERAFDIVADVLESSDSKMLKGRGWIELGRVLLELPNSN